MRKDSKDIIPVTYARASKENYSTVDKISIASGIRPSIIRVWWYGLTRKQRLYAFLRYGCGWELAEIRSLMGISNRTLWDHRKHVYQSWNNLQLLIAGTNPAEIIEEA